MRAGDASRSDLTCLITGATSGIGRAAATALSATGVRVIGTGRGRRRCAEIRDKIERTTGNPRLEILSADLSSQAQVRELAVTVAESHPRLDVLINNAGAMFRNRHISVDGLEMNLALNHLAPFLLTNLLLERLRDSAPARIINVSSEAHAGCEMDLSALQGEAEYSPLGRREYQRSKLANLLFTFELARRLEGSGVTVNAFDPGLVATAIHERAGYPLWRRALLRRSAARPRKAGAELLFLATSPEVRDKYGLYWRGRQPVDPSPASLEPTTAHELWGLSAELTGLS